MSPLSHLRGGVLKDATARVIGAAGGIEAAADLLDHGKSVVGRWSNRNEADRFINVRDVAALEAVTGKPLVTAALCKLAGGVFVALDGADDTGASAAQLAMKLVDITAGTGRLAEETGKALADGHCSADEARAVRAALRQLIAVAAAFDHQLAAIEGL